MVRSPCSRHESEFPRPTAHYRHTTPEMAASIAAAIEQRLTVVLEVAEQALEAHPSRSAQRVF
jgi:hypothetical protein